MQDKFRRLIGLKPRPRPEAPPAPAPSQPAQSTPPTPPPIPVPTSPPAPVAESKPVHSVAEMKPGRVGAEPLAPRPEPGSKNARQQA
ncbi:MAG: hypothetical protein AAB382_06295, partial [Chloroflexota bacterium]